MHLMQTSIKVSLPGARQIAFENTSVAVAWSLVFLVDVEHFIRAHLVAGKEGDWLLNVPRIVPFLHCFDKLVVSGNHIDGHIANI